MGYIALYRKYRPIKFEDIVGQDNVTSILKNQVKNLKISHAYIFSGSRGTGKTTAAKIFSRAINCEKPIEGEPCNVCVACKGILDGDITDVVEMDAASNNSVENIRQIRSEVVYVATSVKYRVYIIDEVHMLTTSAFNALLKTLEEPPDNVIFILATTEQHKIPVTILSRCLRFEFSKIPEKQIEKRLLYVLDKEKVQYEPEAVKYIAKLGDGALRDSLSILDRCLSEKEEILKLEKVEEIIGVTSREVLNNLVNNLLNRNSKEVLNIIDEVVNKGKDLRQLIYSLTEEFLEVLIKDNNKEITNIINELSKLDNEIRYSTKPVILIKSVMIRICNSYYDRDVKIVNTNNLNLDNVNSKINELEEEISKIKSMKISNVAEKNEEKKLVIKDDYKKFKEFDKFKNNLVSQGKLKLFSTLTGSNMFIGDEDVMIVTNNEFAYKILSLDEQKQSILNILNEEFEIDKPIIIKLENIEKENKIEKVLKDNGVTYTNLD